MFEDFFLKSTEGGGLERVKRISSFRYIMKTI